MVLSERTRVTNCGRNENSAPCQDHLSRERVARAPAMAASALLLPAANSHRQQTSQPRVCVKEVDMSCIENHSCHVGSHLDSKGDTFLV